jgi:hypothetical protein
LWGSDFAILDGGKAKVDEPAYQFLRFLCSNSSKDMPKHSIVQCQRTIVDHNSIDQSVVCTAFFEAGCEQKVLFILLVTFVPGKSAHHILAIAEDHADSLIQQAQGSFAQQPKMAIRVIKRLRGCVWLDRWVKTTATVAVPHQG